MKKYLTVHTVTFRLAFALLSLVLLASLALAAWILTGSESDLADILRLAPLILREIALSLVLACGGCLALEAGLVLTDAP